MKRIISFVLVIALAITALTSCDGEIPQKAYNDISGFEVIITPPLNSRSEGKYDSIGLKLRERGDLYDSVSVIIEGYGFDYNFSYTDKLSEKEYEHITKDKINYDITHFADQSNFYEIYEDGEKTDEYYEYSARYSIAKRDLSRGSGCISFTFVARSSVGEESTARYYVYYACDGKYIAYSCASVLAARRALESIFVVY
ncbi:MAG: hypothetical protein II329_04645 [Clostridia bacterium]|nr:hypothetical protein [Clostridia bacterium]